MAWFRRARGRTPVVRARASRPPPSAPDATRIYAVGDVHGCDRLLDNLLALIRQDHARKPPARGVLVLLGDYVDRGLGSARVLQRLHGGVEGFHETVLLKGNHEEMLESFIASPAFLQQWRHFGGIETLASYGVDVRQARVGRGFEAAHAALMAAMPRHHLELIAGLRPSYAAGGYWFCHAGVRPGVTLSRQSPRDLLWIRDEFLSAEEGFGAMVVHGHSPVEQPELLANRINVDTGAYLTGRLTCCVLEGKSVGLISVDGSGRGSVVAAAGEMTRA